MRGDHEEPVTHLWTPAGKHYALCFQGLGQQQPCPVTQTTQVEKMFVEHD